MLKTLSTYLLALGLALSVASMPADASPSSSSSFKSGFSSQRSSRTSSSSSSTSRPSPSKGGFGSFGSRPASAPASDKSESAMSRKLDRERSEANALRTLDERRAAQAAREAPANSSRPAPGYEQRDAHAQPSQGYGYGYGNAPPPAQAPIIINNNGGSGIGHVIAGAMIARSAANAHAHNNGNNNGYNNGGTNPAPGGSAGDLARQAGADSVGSGTAAPSAPAAAKESGHSVFGTILWLALLALIVWAAVRLWKRAQARRAAKQANYSFERN